MATKKQRTAALMRRVRALERGCAVPVNSFEEGLVPDDGKDDEASDKSDDVL